MNIIVKSWCLAWVLLAPSTSFAQACVDTDGDGWGWNGVESCRLAEQPTQAVVTPAVVTPINVDTPSDNDSVVIAGIVTWVTETVCCEITMCAA